MVLLKTTFTKLNNYDCVVSIMCCQYRVCQKLAHRNRIWRFSRKSYLACLSVYIELGNREDDPTSGIQSLLLTLNSKHRVHTKTLVTFAQVTEQQQVRNATLQHQQACAWEDQCWTGKWEPIIWPEMWWEPSREAQSVSLEVREMRQSHSPQKWGDWRLRVWTLWLWCHSRHSA